MEVHCSYCNNVFEKPATEVRRAEKLGKKHYCSLACCGKDNHMHLPKVPIVDISQYAGNRKDEYSDYRVYLRRAHMRDQIVEITLADLKEQWLTQKGLCMYSGVQLQHPVKNQRANHALTASLDRIDSSKGYEKGNIQFISVAMNHMKGVMTHEQTLELIKLIRRE